MKLSKYITTALLDDGLDGISNRIIYSCTTNFSIVVSDAVYNIITNGNFDLLDPNLQKRLQDIGILVPLERDELSIVLQENESKRLNSKILTLFFNVADNCQSGCTTCSPYKNEALVKNGVQEVLISYIKEEICSKRYVGFNIIWNVIDPTINFNTIERVSKFNLALVAQYGILYSPSMICDGRFLTKEIFNVLFRQCSIRCFHITVSGENAEENGTNETINNIITILNSYPFTLQDGLIFEVTIRIDTLNQEEVLGIIDRFESAKAQNRVTFQFTLREHLETNIKDTASLEIEYLFYAIQKGFIQSILPVRTFIPCAAIDSGAISFDVNGNMGSCNSFSLVTNEDDNANLKSPEKDEYINSKKAQIDRWIEHLKDDSKDCYHCSLLPVCGGGCQLKWDNGEKGCPIFKHNIEERLLVGYLNQKMHLSEYIIEGT